MLLELLSGDEHEVIETFSWLSQLRSTIAAAQKGSNRRDKR